MLSMSFKHDRQRRKVMMELNRRGTLPRVTTIKSNTKVLDSEEKDKELDDEEESDD
jgi:hypothetical protein